MGYVFLAAVIPIVARITGDLELMEIAKAASEAVISSPEVRPRMATTAHQGLAIQAVLQKDASQAHQQYQALQSHQGSIFAHSRIAADRLLGLLSSTQGEIEKAVLHFEAARSLTLDSGLRPELAWTCCDYADTLLQRDSTGDREKAMSLLDESLAISSELGMRPLMERVLSRRDILKA